MKMNAFTRLLVPLAAMAVGSACILEAAGAGNPTVQAIIDPGVATPSGYTAPVSSPTLDSLLSLTPTGTITPQPTSTATTAP
ncbi:MAG: hypothetical protein WBM17_14185, partial [Anaerolineales bacterium]